MARPKKLPAERLNAHVTELCEELGILILNLSRTQGGAAGYITFHRHPPETFPFVRFAPVRGPMTYFVALHEIGHHETESEHQLVAEINSWDWAFQHALLDPSTEVLKGIRTRLSTYRAPEDAYTWLDQLDAAIAA